MKAILVIDMPSMCKECPLCYDDCICDIIGDVTDDDSVDMRCPLRPLPKKKDINYAEKTSDGYYTLFSKRYVNGFNACIDEILGEEQ